jgi:hypothetical protein
VHIAKLSADRDVQRERSHRNHVSAALSSTGPDWLPPAPVEEDLSALEPWRPAGIDRLLEPPALRADPRWNQLRHVVIDELDEDTVGLVISLWPRIDKHGRLRFGDEKASKRIATLPEALLTVLAEERVVPIDDDPRVLEALQQRELVVGDVFAAFLTSPPGGGDGGGGSGIVAPGELFRRPVLDITAEARDAVKAQASAAASGTIDKAFLELINEEFQDEEPPPHQPEPQPTPGGQDSSGGTEAEPGVGGETIAQGAKAGTGASEATVDELRKALGAGDEESSETRWDKPMQLGA